MLVHFRLNVPTALVDEVRSLLVGDERVTNVTHLVGASARPEGDVIEADVAREAASAVLDDLNSTGLDQDGGIVLTQPLGVPFAEAQRVDEASHGDPDDAVIWSLIERDAEAASHVTPSYLTFLVIATMLAAVAVITDSAVLVVGAMVVGPEFAVVAAIATAIALRKPRLALRNTWVLLWTFAAAIAVVTALAWLATLGGLITPADVAKARPQTDFIWRPDVWSFIVALLAGAAGVLAMATDRTNAMVGVFISVTTVPAAGNLALGIAVLDGKEMSGSLTQLALNLAGMILAGVVTLAAQRIVWRHVSAATRHRSSERRLAWRSRY